MCLIMQGGEDPDISGHYVLMVMVPDEIVRGGDIYQYQQYMEYKWYEVLEIVKGIVGRHYETLVANQIGIRLTEEETLFVVEEGFSIPMELNGARVFAVGQASVFHAVFLFGIMLARAEGLNEIKEVISLLNQFGMDRTEVGKIIAEIDKKGTIVFFTVKLIRIDEAMREFQARRFSIDISA